MSARTPEEGRGAGGAFACAERLRRSSDVRSAFAAGRTGTALLVVHGRRRPDEGVPRATVVAGKKVGNAVQRNRVKRRLRAAMAQTRLPVGFDLVIVGRRPAATAPFSTLLHDVDAALAKLVQRS